MLEETVVPIRQWSARRHSRITDAIMEEEDDPSYLLVEDSSHSEEPGEETKTTSKRAPIMEIDTQKRQWRESVEETFLPSKRSRVVPWRNLSQLCPLAMPASCQMHLPSVPEGRWDPPKPCQDRYHPGGGCATALKRGHPCQEAVGTWPGFQVEASY